MTSALGSVASLAARAGGSVVRQVRAVFGDGGAGAAKAPSSGWLAVSIHREPTELDTTALPAPLAAYGDRIETRIRPAPGGKGTELAARLRDRPSGTALSRVGGSDPQADLRSALRQAKQLIEVGEVLEVDPTPHGKRNGTPTGAALEAATKRAPKGGVL